MNPAQADSFLRVPYDLRPKKQVERRMLIDAFQILASEGFAIRDYQYTGMGSTYFVDFILFHKFLGIHDMVSVEHSEGYRRRVEFNRPFRLVTLKAGRIGDYIPDLAADRRHLVWLDYDMPLTASLLGDVALAATYLSPGSILLITVDVEPPKPDPAEGGETPAAETGTPAAWQAYFMKQAGAYLDPGWSTMDFAKSKLPLVNSHALEGAIRNGLTGRADLEFTAMFNFEYADGHRMVTCGGMFATAAERGKLAGSALYKTIYARRAFASTYEILVPLLTRKERLHLDSIMPRLTSEVFKDFEIDEEDLKAYSEVYRFLPAYAELLL